MVGTIGFDETLTLVLTAPPFIVSVIVGPLRNLSSGKYNERSWHITCMMLLAMVEFISAATLNVAARCVACFCYAVGVYAVNSSILGWVTATLGQTMQKKVISLGFVNIMANASYIYTPYRSPSSHDPEYTTGMATEAAFTAGVIICVWALRAWLMATNAKLRRSGEEHGLLYAY